MAKSLVMAPEKCTSCLQCELACSFRHTGLFNPARSRIKVFELGHGERSSPYTCTQCAEAWCRQACPVDALARNPETGAIEVIEANCTGCRACAIACPYGTINLSTDTAKAVKCDLCSGDPQCVVACPTGAILFEDALGAAE